MVPSCLSAENTLLDEQFKASELFSLAIIRFLIVLAVECLLEKSLLVPSGLSAEITLLDEQFKASEFFSLAIIRFLIILADEWLLEKSLLNE